ncbi:hypothetical protein [Gryllotalpicola koreensis]|uniref:DRBM domain-containing protein n=1 Tax=Gryllotalpicola koreensis TaxID=993086 RepID=A0ABP8A1W8_9MICO
MKIERDYVKNQVRGLFSRRLWKNRNIAGVVYYASGAGGVSGVGNTPREAVNSACEAYRMWRQSGASTDV